MHLMRMIKVSVDHDKGEPDCRPVCRPGDAQTVFSGTPRFRNGAATLPSYRVSADARLAIVQVVTDCSAEAGDEVRIFVDHSKEPAAVVPAKGVSSVQVWVIDGDTLRFVLVSASPEKWLRITIMIRFA